MKIKYKCDAQQRLLKMVDEMVGYEVFGLSVKDLSDKVQSSNATVFRDLQNLQLAGWAEQFGDGKWRLSVNAAKMLRSINDGLNSAAAKVNEARRAYQEF